jgi:hypothetical protein
MPTAALNTYGNQGLVPVNDRNLKAQQMSIKLINSVTYAKGTVLGQVTAGGLYKAYTSGAVDGSQNPRCLLAYDCVVDGSGNITIGGGSQMETYPTAPAFFTGEFNAADLTGLDATALVNGKWMSVYGDTSTGVIRLPS